MQLVPDPNGPLWALGGIVDKFILVTDGWGISYKIALLMIGEHWFR